MKKEKVKKPIYKRWWFWLIIVIVVIGACSGGSDSSKDTEVSEAATESTEAAETEESVETEEAVETTEYQTVYNIIGGELGEFGQIVSLGEDVRYEYALPAGTYDVTNNDAYMRQLDVIALEITKDSDGNDEQVWYSAELYDSGEKKELTLEDGQVVEIEEGESWTFALK